MNVYVESNFVLELTLLQEEHQSCEGILSLCETGNARLIIPAYCLAEPYETLIRRDRDRNQLAKTIETELKQLGRSKPYKAETDAFKAVIGLLTRSGAEEKQRLSRVRDRLLQSAEVIPLDNDILALTPVYETEQGLSPQDSIVYASVLRHLNVSNSSDNCFLTKNVKDFADPDIKEILASYNCKVLFNFGDGYHYLQHRAG